MSDEGQWCDPGYCQLAEVSNYAKGLKEKLAKAVEALEGLIQQTYDCEKELTEGLHHVDFCGESEPLTNARATLAEIKSGVATTPYGLEGENHE